MQQVQTVELYHLFGKKKNSDDTWNNFEPITTTTYTDKIESSIKITVEKGQFRTFRCIITNTNNSVNGNKTANIETNDVTVAYVEGTLTSITAQYTGQCETFGSRPYSSVKVTETYTSGSKTTDVTVTANAIRYTIEPKNDNEKAIGFVPYTVKYNEGSGNITTEIRVPVKYQLSAGDFVITSTTNEIGNSTSSNPEKIAQFTGNTTLEVKTSETSNIPNEIYKDENSATAEVYNILEKLQSEWTKTFNNSTTNIYDTTVANATEGQYIYQATLTSYTNSWCVGDPIVLEYEVEVCPWTLTVIQNTSIIQDLANLTGGTNYKLYATNEAVTNPTVTWVSSDNNVFNVNDSTLKTPEATTNNQTAIITAKVSGIEIGSVEVTVQGNPEYHTIVSSWYSLKTEIENILANTYTEDNPYVIAIDTDLQTTSYINVTQPVKIIPLKNVTITRLSNKNEFFYTSAYFEIAGTPNAKITLDGDEIQATNPIINATSSLTLSYCDFKDIINTSTAGGAIYVNKNDTSTINVNLSNCNFNNNSVTSTVNGGAVALYGKSIISKINNCTFTNNKATNGSGGALYIYGTTTVQNTKIHTLKDCIFSNNQTSSESGKGGALYLERGTLILDGITMTGNKDYLDNNSDIFVYNDFCYVTLENKNTIDCFIDQFGSEDNPEIKLGDNFNTASKINFLCVASSGASVDDGDTLIDYNDTTNK